jgi:hypothetical protein
MLAICNFISYGIRESSIWQLHMVCHIDDSQIHLANAKGQQSRKLEESMRGIESMQAQLPNPATISLSLCIKTNISLTINPSYLQTRPIEDMWQGNFAIN